MRSATISAVLAAVSVFAATPARAADGTPTFAKDVAPIFQKSCQTCHHQGTSAPMSLVTYEEARPWAQRHPPIFA